MRTFNSQLSTLHSQLQSESSKTVPLLMPPRQWDVSDWFGELGEFLNVNAEVLKKRRQPLDEQLSGLNEEDEHYQDILGILYCELEELGGIKRIVNASVLIRCLSLVEVTLKVSYQKLTGNVLAKNGIGEMKNALLEEMENCEVLESPSWQVIDNIRKLCNCFKHQGGIIDIANGESVSDKDKELVELFPPVDAFQKGCFQYHVPYEEVDVEKCIYISDKFCMRIFEDVAKNAKKARASQ